MHRMQRGPAELRRRGSGHKYFLCNSGEKLKLARAAEKFKKAGPITPTLSLDLAGLCSLRREITAAIQY